MVNKRLKQEQSQLSKYLQYKKHAKGPKNVRTVHSGVASFRVDWDDQNQCPLMKEITNLKYHNPFFGGVEGILTWLGRLVFAERSKSLYLHSKYLFCHPMKSYQEAPPTSNYATVCPPQKIMFRDAIASFHLRCSDMY